MGIPDRIKLKVKRHAEWYESARVWVALVGPPSAKKSPVLRAATGPVSEIDIKLHKSWQKAMKRWLELEPEEKKATPMPVQTRLSGWKWKNGTSSGKIWNLSTGSWPVTLASMMAISLGFA